MSWHQPPIAMVRTRARGTVSWPPPWLQHGNERSPPKATSWAHACGKTETAALSTHTVFNEEVVTVSRLTESIKQHFSFYNCHEKKPSRLLLTEIISQVNPIAALHCWFGNPSPQFQCWETFCSRRESDGHFRRNNFASWPTEFSNIEIGG